MMTTLLSSETSQAIAPMVAKAVVFNGTAAGFGTGGKFLTLTNKPVLTENQFLIQA